jgi:hypothetical protein
MTALRFAMVGACTCACSWMLLTGSNAFQAPIIARGRLPIEQRRVEGRSRISFNYFNFENPCLRQLGSANSEYPDYDDFELDYKYYTDMQVMADDYDYDFHASSESESESEEDRWKIQVTNHVLRTLHYSFKNVEGTANGLLEENPLIAFAIFAGAGLVAAYLLGLLILDGCMESWNPIQNGVVPYWDEEILVMVRKIH